MSQISTFFVEIYDHLVRNKTTHEKHQYPAQYYDDLVSIAFNYFSSQYGIMASDV